MYRLATCISASFLSIKGVDIMIRDAKSNDGTVKFVSSIERLKHIMTKYKDTITKLNPGESVTLECPFCKGKLLIDKSEYNGHLFIKCDNKCVFIIE